MSEKDINNLKEMLIDFNEYSTDYTKTRCRELEETIDNTLKEIERLNKQIEEYQKALDETTSEKINLENIIKEVREWAKKYSCQFTNDDGELVVSEISFNIQARPCDLFKILDKEVN